MQMTPTKIFRKTESAYELARIFAIIFWMPIIALCVLWYLIN